jgi:ATP-dependent protease ClpP protease subunit
VRKKLICIALAEGARSAEIVLRGFIGAQGASLEDVADQIGGLAVDSITVRINSLGGLTWEGVAIYNALRAHPAKIVVLVEGFAGGAASVVAMAGDEIVMYANAVMMIHGVVAVDEWGEEIDTREAREMARACNASLIETYKARTGKSEKDLAAMLAADTWMTAREAVAAGFADRVESLTPAVEASGLLAAFAVAAGIPAAVLVRAAAEAAASAKRNPKAMASPTAIYATHNAKLR